MSDAAPPVSESAAVLIRRLVAEDSPLGHQLSASLELLLRDQLTALWSHLPTRNDRWTALLVDAIHTELLRQEELRRGAGGEPLDVDALCSEFAETPVLQQADHANLLLDQETYLNNLLFATSASLVGRRFAVTSQCSTVVCFSRRIPPSGPVFLHSRGSTYNVFGFSKNRYRRSNFCALRGPLTLVLADGPTSGDPILELLRGRRFPNAEDAFLVANQLLAAQLPLRPARSLVQIVHIDERTTAAAVARHLEHDDSPLRRLILEPEVRRTFLAVKEEVVASSANLAVNRASPDWFWWRRGERLHGLVDPLHNGTCRSEVDGVHCDVPLEARALAAALRSGVLVADRVASYLVRCLLTGVVAVGGTVQQDYVNAYRSMLLECHRRLPFLDADATARLGRTDLSRLGGAPLLELDAESTRMVATLGSDTPVADWLEHQLDRPVGQTIGKFSCAWFYHDLLAEVDRKRELEVAGGRTS